MSNTEAERRYKRAHWRACRELINRHGDEFVELLAAEQGAEAGRTDDRSAAALAEIETSWAMGGGAG